MKEKNSWVAESVDKKTRIVPLLDGMIVKIAYEGRSAKGATIPTGEYYFMYQFDKTNIRYVPVLLPKGKPSESGYTIDFAKTKIET